MTRTSLRWAVIATAVVALSACQDQLVVENPNSGNTDKVLATPADAENLLGSYYKRWHSGVYGSIGSAESMANIFAFQTYSSLANECMNSHAPFTGAGFTNTPGNTCQSNKYRLYSIGSEVNRVASSFLAKLAPGTGYTLGTPARDLRQADAVPRLRVAGGQLGRSRQAAFRQVDLVGFELSQPQRAPRDGIRAHGFIAQVSAQGAFRLQPVALFELEQADVEPRLGETAVPLQRPQVSLQRLAVPARGPVGQPEMIPRPGFRRQVGDRLFQQRDRLLLLPGPQRLVAAPQRLHPVRTAAGQQRSQQQGGQNPRNRKSVV